MSEIAVAKINSFAPIAAQTDFSVSPSEEAVFILTTGQLQDLIKEAIQPLQDEVSLLQATMTAQDEKIAALESTQNTQADNQLIMLRLINNFREATKKEPQPTQKDRAEILRALLAANGGKMLAKDARQKMHLSRSRFSELLAIMSDDIEIKPYYLSKRQNILALK